MKRQQSEKKRTRETELKFRKRSRIVEKRKDSKADRLRRLGFETYNEYLASDLWHTIREFVRAHKGSKCVKCGRLADTIHHARYDMETLRGRTLEWLWPVCKQCHKWSENSPRLANEPAGKLDRANFRLGVPS